MNSLPDSDGGIHTMIRCFGPDLLAEPLTRLIKNQLPIKFYENSVRKCSHPRLV